MNVSSSSNSNISNTTLWPSLTAAENQVDLVGILRNYEIQSMKATCTLQDHTGKIKAFMWLLNIDPETMPQVKEGNVVRIFGSIQCQDGEKSIMILKMFPIDDCNIIVNHLLQAVHTRLAAEKIKHPSAAKLEPSTSVSNTAEPERCSLVQELTPLERQVLNILKSFPGSDPRGCSTSDILDHFTWPETNKVPEALQNLLNEGHAYTTTDYEHYKSTD